MASVEMKKRKREEYEMQLFGFHSRAVYAALKKIVYDKVESRCEKLCNSIEKKYKPDAEGSSKLRAEMKQLIKMYREGAEPHLKTIENVVNRFVAVPSNILLEEDKGQAIQYTKEQFENMQQQLELEQHRLRRAAVLNAALKKELEDLNQFKLCEDTLNDLCSVTDKTLIYPHINNKMLKLARSCQGLEKQLNSLIPKTDKNVYNPKFDNLKLREIDLNSL